jgi:threonine aldolase
MESNQLFMTIPRPLIDFLHQSYHFYFWNEENREIRLVTSFDTTEEDVFDFAKQLSQYYQL